MRYHRVNIVHYFLIKMFPFHVFALKQRNKPTTKFHSLVKISKKKKKCEISFPYWIGSWRERSHTCTQIKVEGTHHFPQKRKLRTRATEKSWFYFRLVFFWIFPYWANSKKKNNNNKLWTNGTAAAALHVFVRIWYEGNVMRSPFSSFSGSRWNTRNTSSISLRHSFPFIFLSLAIICLAFNDDDGNQTDICWANTRGVRGVWCVGASTHIIKNTQHIPASSLYNTLIHAARHQNNMKITLKCNMICF